MRDISARKGDVTLFAKSRRFDALGPWDLVVSAPWLEAGQLKATRELVELLSDSVGQTSLHEFARIQTVGTDHPTVKFMMDNFAVAPSSYVTVVGRASLISDAAEKQKHWKADWTSIYPKGARDDGFMSIRLMPNRLEIVNDSLGMVGDPKTWLPLTIEFATPRR